MKLKGKKKINFIKWWLQSFGERANDTFYKDIEADGKKWCLSLEYNFDMYGIEYEPTNWCICINDDSPENKLQLRTPEELDSIIKELSIINLFH